MRYPFLLFATTLVAAQITFAQNGRSGSCDANSCTATFTFGPRGIPYLSARRTLACKLRDRKEIA